MKIDKNVLIDTNILVYFFNQDSKFHNFSREIINSNPKNIFIAQKSISEFISVMSKLGKYEIIDLELDKIISYFKILYANEISIKIFTDLIRKYKPIGNRVYDYEIVSVMLSNDIRTIVTLNVQDFKIIQEIEIISF